MTVPNNPPDTYFQIAGLGLMPSSARGLKCDYKPIENGKTHYDVWGIARNTARAALALYKVSVSCQDIWPPAFASLARGQAHTIIGLEMIEPTYANQTLSRPAYNGVVTYYDWSNNVLPNANGAAFVGYQPVFQVILEDFDISTDEWGATVSWRLDFTETR